MKPLIKVIITLSIILIGLQFFQNELAFDRLGLQNQQWYRIISGNLVHSNYPHLLLNLAGLFLAGFLFIDTISSKTFIISTVFLSICVGVGLYYFNPELTRYYGFSGILYGLFVIGATTLLLQKDYFTGFALLIFISGKVIWDIINGGNDSSADLIGVPVAIDAHLYGVIGAIIFSVLLYVLSIRKN